MSVRSTKLFLEGHTTLREHVEHLLVAAHELPALERNERLDMVERIAAFLAEMLLPHAAAEQRVLYPEAAALLGEQDASDTCADDRDQVRDLLGRLAVIHPDDVGGLQEMLFALYVLLSAHLWREEEIYLKLAGDSDQASACAILDRMTEAEHRGGRFARRGGSLASK